MCASQREGCELVVERCILPIGRVMTRAAICSELPIMLIVATVTGIAVHRRALINAVLVASFASNLSVLPLELEDRKVMVEPGGFPAIG